MARRLHLHATTKQFPIEVLVALNDDFCECVTGSPIDSIRYAQLVFGWVRMPLDSYFNVEISASLEIIQQVTPALVDQVVIERAFFVNRHISLEDATTNFETTDSDIHRGAGINLEVVVHGICFRPVVALGNGDLRQQTVSLLIFLPQPLQGPSDMVNGNAVSGVHLGDVLDLALRVAGIAGRGDLTHVSLRPWSDTENKVYLLRFRVRNFVLGHIRAVIAVLLH